MMATVLVWMLCIMGLVSLAYFKAAPRNWLIISAVLLLLVTPWAGLPVAIAVWLLWSLLAVFMLLPGLRRAIFTKPIMRWFRRVQPSLTEAEREVLASGNTWWEREFFTGDPNWEKILHYTQPHLSAEEQAFLHGPVDRFCALLDEWQIERDQDLSPAAWQMIHQERLWGLCIPKQYGGHGFSALAHSEIVARIASRSLSAAFTVMVPNALGPAMFVELFGSEADKQYYLPRLARGEEVACFALTSPSAGSDAASIIDEGVVCMGQYEGQSVLGVRLTFDKRYITLAPIATLIGLAFHLRDPQRLLGGAVELGITCALIPAHLPGIQLGERHQPMTSAFMNGTLRGTDVFIPIDKLVGGAKGAGAGWRMLMECLSLGRGISLPSMAAAVTQVCFRTSSAYAQVRRQFKRPIGAFEGVAHALAQIGGYSYLTDATRLFTVAAVDAGKKPSIASAIAKLHLTELARVSVNLAMDIHGGRAVQKGPRNYLASLYETMPICVTVEGANILTRNLIVFGQGLVRCHPYLSHEMEIMAEPTSEHQVKQFDRVLMQHIGFTVSRFARSLVYGLTGGRFIRSCRGGLLKTYLQQFTRMSAGFALLTDITLLVMGAKLKTRESLSARFGDIISELYMASAVLQRFEQLQEPEAELPLVEWSLSYCLNKIQQSFYGILDNFPTPWLGRLLTKIIFPWGSRYCGPSDDCNARVAALMMTDGLLRDKLTQHCYVGQPPDPIALVDSVFCHSAAMLTLLRRYPDLNAPTDQEMLWQLAELREQRVIPAEDAELIAQFLQARIEANHVDEFLNGRETNGPKNYYRESHR